MFKKKFWSKVLKYFSSLLLGFLPQDNKAIDEIKEMYNTSINNDPFYGYKLDMQNLACDFEKAWRIR